MATAESKHTLLLVDDERDNLDALERIFRKKYEIIKSTSGQEALNLIKGKKITVIISDQRMPQMTGVEFLEKSLIEHPNTVRILLTGYTDIESVIAAVNSGQIYRYVTKPWDPRDLEVAVERAVERFVLREDLKNKNMELEKALKELRALDETKSQFMVLMNHELKTPLTTLLSYMDLLKESKLDEEQNLFLKRMSTSGEKLKEIIFDMLEFVSAETGLTKIKSGSHKTKDLLQKSVESVTKEASAKSLKVETKDNSLSVSCDSDLIANVLSRLLENAVRFADTGTKITLLTEKKNNGVYFQVENTGKPISKDTIEKILQPFTLDENIMNHSKGIGLGLSICQAILKLHKSQLNIESEGNIVRFGFLIS